MARIKFLLTTLVICFLSIVAMAQNTTTKSTKPTIILVHGLWADGSAWNKVTAILQAEGYPVIAVQNPTTSLEDDVAATNRAINQATGDVILVGHSWGGFVIGEAGISNKVKGLVYIAALIPDKGETIGGFSAQAAPTNLGSYLVNNNGYLTLSKQGVQEAFAGDLSAKEQNLIFATQPPASQKVFEAIAQNTAWKNKPSFYLVATQDGAINPELERLMAKRANATIAEVDASHVPMLSQPNAVLKIIKQAIAAI